MDFLLLAQVCALGAAVGVLGSVFGLGGGIFAIPALVLYFHVPMHSAVALSLAAIIAASSSVASVNVGRGLANMKLGLALEAFTVPGAALGAFAASRLDAKVLQLLFSLLLCGVSVVMARRAFKKTPDASAVCEPGALGGRYTDPATGKTVSYAVRHFPFAAAAAVGAGALSGLLGVGGGIIKVPTMRLVCGVPLKAAAATSNFMLGMTAAASAAVYFSKGFLVADIGAALVLGVLAGAALGVRTLSGMKAERLELAFAALVLGIGVKMFLAAGVL